MRFYFDIDDDIFYDEYGCDFKQEVANQAIQSIVSGVYDNETNLRSVYSNAQEQVADLIKSRQDEIILGVIECVAEKIARKKAIAAITPKASDLAAADEDNVAYFEQMIDKAIAKKFGK